MNPVAAKAQESVPIPEGLNLNAALVAPSAYANEADDAVWEASSDAEEVDLGQGGGAGMEELRRVIRESVGKEKGKKKKKRVKGSGEQETEEERQLVGRMFFAGGQIWFWTRADILLLLAQGRKA